MLRLLILKCNILKWRVNLVLFVLDCYKKKWELTDITGHDSKLTSDMNLILAS